MFKYLKERINYVGITIDDIANNTGIDKDLLLVILDDKTNVARDISTLFDFFKFTLHLKASNFWIHNITPNKDRTQYKITRTIIPKCSAYYDVESKSLYNFKCVGRIKPPKADQDIYIESFYKTMDDYFEYVNERDLDG